MTLPTFEKYTGLHPETLRQVNELLAILKRHAHGDPITGCQLALLMRWQRDNMKGDDARVRAAISYLRVVESHPIASEGDGYFWATTPEQLDQTIEHLRGRAAKISVVLNAMKHAQQQLTHAQTSMFKDDEGRERP